MNGSIDSGCVSDSTTSFPDAICPLCSEVFSAKSFKSISEERPKVRQNTILVIQTYHPDWKENQGACVSCWNSYRNAGRILELLRMSHAGSKTKE